jgi:hypothetical protein
VIEFFRRVVGHEPFEPEIDQLVFAVSGPTRKEYERGEDKGAELADDYYEGVEDEDEEVDQESDDDDDFDDDAGWDDHDAYDEVDDWQREEEDERDEVEESD